MIYRVDGNTLTAYGSIWEGDGMRFIDYLKDLEDQAGPITIKLHTPGGSVFDGNLIHNALRSSKADIRIEIIGIAASMGAVIALSRDEVYLAENGFLMIHAPSGMTYGNAAEHLQTAKLLRSIEGNFVKKLSHKTGRSTHDARKWLSGNNWFDAQEAKTEGLIAGVIDAEAEVEELEDDDYRVTNLYERFAAVLLPNHPEESPRNWADHLSGAQKTIPEPKSQSKTSEMKILAKHLGLSEEATEETILKAIKAQEKQLESVRSSLKKAEQTANKLKAAEDNRRKAEIGKKVDAAVKDGRLDASGADAVKALPAETAEALLKALPKRDKISDNLDDGSDPLAQFKGKSWDELDRQGLLAELKETDPDYFEELKEKEFGKAN